MGMLMLSSTTREPPTDGDPIFGDFLALLTAFFYGSYQLLIKYFRREHSGPLLLFWASLVAAMVLFPLAWFHSDPFWPGSTEVWGSLIGLGVLSHACGQGLIAYGLGGVPASLAAVTLLVQPVATAFLGILILGQPLVSIQMIGAAIVVTGLFLAIRGKSTPR
jgi:drug/metabolite transporter (DMT)-like permease